jgi:hypothetical protein
MSRKLVFCAVSALALMTFVVSAQQPAQPTNRSPGELTKPYPGAAPSLDLAPTAQNPFWSNGNWNARTGMHQEEMQLEHESVKLVQELGKAEGENKDKIKSKLTETLGKQFDARQKRHEAEIAALEAKIKKLKEMVQKRQENRREIISKRLEQLVRETEGLGW